jgi:peptidoglycan LD-endopeptidase CwlK
MTMLTPRDWGRLEGVHPHLRRMVECAALFAPVHFTVLEGVRSATKQAQNVASGVSQTMNSRHLTGHAVDLGVLDEVGVVTWEWPYYDRFAVHMKGGATLCGYPIEWGGDWTTLKDGPHWQLPWEQYPVKASPPPAGTVVA